MFKNPKHISRTEKVINLYNKAKEEEMKSEKEEITNNIQKAQNGDFVYIGLFLTEESRNKLYDIFTIPLESKVYMEHCTLLFKRTQMEHKNAQKVIDAYVNQLNKKNHNVTVAKSFRSFLRLLVLLCPLSLPERWNPDTQTSCLCT